MLLFVNESAVLAVVSSMFIDDQYFTADGGEIHLGLKF